MQCGLPGVTWAGAVSVTRSKWSGAVWVTRSNVGWCSVLRAGRAGSEGLWSVH